MKLLSKIFFLLWQLPQEIVGFVLMSYYFRKGKITKIQPYKTSCVFRTAGFSGGLSLGRFIFVQRLDYTLVCHEYGHSRQSKILGWLYLLVIGLPSLVWCKLWKESWKKSYYWFYTEKWADFLGSVKRIA